MNPTGAQIKEKEQKPAKKSCSATKPRVQNERLKAWNEIASFLGQPLELAQRWATKRAAPGRFDLW
jgi:hypothetical protein